MVLLGGGVYVLRQVRLVLSAGVQPVSGRIVGQRYAAAHAALRQGKTLDGTLLSQLEDSDSSAVSVVIVGGGIAGLVAAWELQKRGVSFRLLEMEDDVGGNARAGYDGPGGLAYPWGAHYVPIPSRRAHAVRGLFVELGLLRKQPPARRGSDSVSSRAHRNFEGVRADEALESDLEDTASVCAEPSERLYMPNTGWRDRQDGLVPWELMGVEDQRQFARERQPDSDLRASALFQRAEPERDPSRVRLSAARLGTDRRCYALPIAAQPSNVVSGFRALVDAESQRRTEDDRPAFAVPLADCSSDSRARALDGESMGGWLARHGFTSAPLHWFVEYATRDDYGASLNDTSAWVSVL